METVIVELTNQKALKLLEELEDLKILKLIRPNETKKLNLSEKYEGKISKELADKLQLHISESRNQWESNT
ncbi:MAG: hypothetical protein LCH37_10255 [Bacteroidetes bacterium]|nr:hypothetical protein [Bacteroidota bacterium]